MNAVKEWNRSKTLYRPDATVHQLIREQAGAIPDRPALVWAGGQMTYRELDRRSDDLARRLIDEGVGPDVPVAVSIERSPEAVVAVLAILKAGGCYLPIDPQYPKDRLTFIIGDANAPVLITRRSLAGQLDALAPKTLFVEDPCPEGPPLGERVSPTNVAYLMYTSGSTGNPKGVLIEHKSIVRLVGGSTFMRLDRETVFLQAAPLGFDLSTLELWGPLCHGGRVAIYLEAVPTGPGLARTIQAHRITSAWLTSSLFNTVVDEDPKLLTGLRQLAIGGEALSPPHVLRALEALPDTEIINGYGPTEVTTFTTTHSIPRDTPKDAKSIPIGRPIADTQVYVLDADRKEVPFGEVGELYAGGLGVARGYHNRPELDAERFIPDTFTGKGRLYKTGDLVRFLPDGTLDFIGRADGQVKIRGFRLELGEIEVALSHLPQVQAAAVVARDDGTGKRIVAYVVPSGDQFSPTQLREALLERLPDFMIPTLFIRMSALPMNTNGKLDRKALPAPESTRPDLAQPYRAPTTEREKLVCQVFAELLGLDRVGVDDRFFELGGNSLMSLRVLARLRDAGLPELAPALFFAAPTPAALARRFDGKPGPDRARTRRREPGNAREPIAIVGMAGRFPGARDVETLWQNLVEGRETVRFFKPEELDPSIREQAAADPSYVLARGVLDDVEMFDSSFFGISPLEAQVMDPQQRHFLEVSWEALENAGYVPETVDGAVGVFGGMYNATYFEKHLLPRPEVRGRVAELQVTLGNEKDYVTMRAAHRLNLTGPAISVNTGCSTAIVATAMAMDSLRNGQSDVALAGAVAVTCPPASGYLYAEGAQASPDGHTRTFDAKAGGTVFSDGIGLVVLKRLSDAIADGDTIYATLLGAALNNDGSERASFTAPSPDGQAAVISAALDAAGVDPRTISYVEAHGTATPLGDPIEIEGLTRAYRQYTSDRGFCSIGSIKSNVGHMTVAAGVGGLIKTSLALHRELLPPTIHFTAPNPKIDFESSPFRVASTLTEWKTNGSPRRAGVSAFGFGGTNSHVILEEAPPATQTDVSKRPAQLLVLSARTPAALAEATTKLARFLESKPSLALADVAHTLQRGRRSFSHRRYVVASEISEAVRLLDKPEPAKAGAREALAELPELAFLCPGQGSQYSRMGHGLYEAEPVFRAAFDECCTHLQTITGKDPREDFFSEAPSALTATGVTQPAIFTLEYSLARLWMSWGVKPKALIGHSVGEWVCATLAGVMTLADAIALVLERGRRMQALPAGSMLSVRLGADALAPKLPNGVVIASENAPGLCVASGPTPEIAKLEEQLAAEGVVTRRLVTSHAFHSPMMDSVMDPLIERIAQVELSPPKIPILSTVTGKWLTDEEATNPRYWGEHLRRPVRFAPAVAQLLEDPRRALIEIGPRATLSALARQANAPKRAFPVAIPSIADAPEREVESISAALGQVWSLGIPIDWAAYGAHERRRRIPLPTYPFQRQRLWVDAPLQTKAAAPAAQAPIAQAPLATSPAPAQVSQPSPPTVSKSQRAAQRKERLTARVRELVEDVSGLEVGELDPSTPWLELGLDSLTLTQLALQVQRSVGVKVTFRQIMEDFPSIADLVAMLDEQLPPDPAEEPAPAPVATVIASVAPNAPPPPFSADTSAITGAAMANPHVRQVIEQQLQIMSQQLALLGVGSVPAVAQPAEVATTAAAPVVTPAAPMAATGTPAALKSKSDDEHAGPMTYDVKKAFGAIARIHTSADTMTAQQRGALAALEERYNARTRRSKEYTAQHRVHMADPRVVNGFRPVTKELTYQIVVERSRGSRVWDIDGNEYVDVLNGFGMSMFGWQPDFLRKAVHDQVDLGYEIGPQHVLSGEVARLFCDITGADRAAFCNTGSEAVMGTMRVARTVTGRSLICSFAGSYHGIFDEVIVRGTKKLKTIPAAPGILPASSQNMLVLDYGTPESLEILRQRADELAAVLVEPVQSRRPDFAPVEFLREVRKITERSGTALIFDEVITGLRSHPRGAQGLFGIDADIASYGKVVGGGFPIGVIAGKRKYMDALDGGHWQYGDDSIPSVGVTYFAGTFVRHPLALAAAKASLLRMKEEGPDLQKQLTAKTAGMVAELNAFMSDVGAPLRLSSFASLFRNVFTEELPYGDLVYVLLRERGVHILDNFPCFLTTAHTDADVAFVVDAYKGAVKEMQESGFFPPARGRVASASASTHTNGTSNGNGNGYGKHAPSLSNDAPGAVPGDPFATPPVPGARLGKNRDGSPAWFVPDAARPGKFLLYSPPSSGEQSS